MPRQYSPTPDDRYILEEEGDVTEINFVISGEWAVAFNTHVIGVESQSKQFEEVKEIFPVDMLK
jgi:hypothetical protein